MPPHWMNDPQGLALLEAAKREYDATAPRLVLSDWLEEQGEQEAAQALRRSLLEPQEWLYLSTEAADRWVPINCFHAGWPARFVHIESLHLHLRRQPSEWLVCMAIRNTNIDSPLAISFAQSCHFHYLCSLELSSNELGYDGARSLLQAPTISNLNAFACDFNEIGPEGLRNIGSINFRFLSYLSIMDNGLGDLGIEHLSELRSDKLRHLNLAGNGITSSGAGVLADSAVLKNVDTFLLPDNDLGDEGVRVLVDSPCLANVKHLNLRFNQIGDEGARALLNSPNLTSLRFLNLGGNNIQSDLIARQLYERFPEVVLWR